MSILKAGLRLKSAVCDAEVMVIKCTGEESVTCGGVPMRGPDEQGEGEAVAELMNGCNIGKRYVTDDHSLELLCVKPGAGSLAVNGTKLSTKDAKPLPSSD